MFESFKCSDLSPKCASVASFVGMLHVCKTRIKNRCSINLPLIQKKKQQSYITKGTDGERVQRMRGLFIYFLILKALLRF